MIYKKIEISPCDTAKLKTFLLFEVVSARASGTEILRIDMLPTEDEKELARLIRDVKRLLRAMKERGTIQCFAFPESFDSQSAEAMFILNKYSALIGDTKTIPEGGSCVYVKT